MTWQALYENPATGGINLSPDAIYGHDGESEWALRKAFNWLTRTGAGRRFGSMPIGWYQQHQIAALDVLHDAATKRGLPQNPSNKTWLFRYYRGEFQAWGYGHLRWENLGLSARQVFEQADRKTR